MLRVIAHKLWWVLHWALLYPIFKVKESNLNKISVVPKFEHNSDSKANCDIIQMPNVQRQVGMRKGSKTANSTHDYGGLVVAEPGQDWLC